ncbi:MAG: hypothetical protein SGJ18_09525 [Pseudomonadota bacterium]|nr:hypothetical protein [Pseudomonadota bacterium]
MTTILLLMSFFIGEQVPAQDLSSVNHNRKGVVFLKEGQAYSAQNEFLKALEDEPFSAGIHLNLGLAFEMNKEPDKALKEYLQAIRYATDSDTRFYANFNAGQVVGDANIDLALSYYQAALEEKPESQETKQNIELLTQQKQGKGKGDKKDDKSDSENEDEEKDPNAPRTNEPKEKPKPFDSKEMTEEDVKRVLQELKNQEQSIRARQEKQDKQQREAPLDKDW